MSLLLLFNQPAATPAPTTLSWVCTSPGVWVQAIPWVCVSPGVWEQATEVYVGEDSLNIPSANLQVFLFGDDTDGSNNSTRVNGVALNNWVNKGALGGVFSNATGAQRPLFASSLLNGRAGATFDGTDDRLSSSLAASAFTFFHDGTGCSVYAVVRTSINAHQTIVATTTGVTTDGAGLRVAANFAAQYFMLAAGATQINALGANSSAPSGFFNVVSATLASAASPDAEVYANGLSVATGNAAAFSSLAPSMPMFLGSSPVGTVRLTGSICCLLVYNVAHDATTQAAIKAAIEAYYGTLPA